MGRRQKRNKAVKTEEPFYRKPCFFIIVVVLASLISYIQTFSYSFCLDDEKLITARSGDYESKSIVSAIFTTPFWGSSPERDTQYYRPIVTLTYWMNYQLVGTSPAFYHIFNVAVHAFNGILLFYIVKLLTKRKFLALFIALIFITHPIHISSVAWVSGRTDLLALMFLLLSYFSYVKERLLEVRGNYKWSLLAAISYLLALLSKESAILFPLVILASDLIIFRLNHKSKEKKEVFLPYLMIVITLFLYFILRASALGKSFPERILREAFSWQAFCHIPSVFVYYIKSMFIPFTFYLHPNWIITTSLWETAALVNGILFISLIGSFFIFRKASIRMGVLIFVLSILPVVYTLLEDSPVREYWAYIPSVAFAIMAVELLFLTNKWKIGSIKVGYVLACILIVLYMVLCWSRNPVFKNNLALYSDGIRKRPDMTFYYINLGAEVNDAQLAKSLFEKALTIDPTCESANRNIGVLYENGGNYVKAIEYYNKELAFYPDKMVTLMYLGKAYLVTGQEAQADEYFEKAFQIDPKFIGDDLYRTALAYYGKGNKLAAIFLLEIVAKHSNDLPEVYMSLGTLYEQEGRYEDAINVWNQFLAFFPKDERVEDIEQWIKDVEEKIKNEK